MIKSGEYSNKELAISLKPPEYRMRDVVCDKHTTSEDTGKIVTDDAKRIKKNIPKIVVCMFMRKINFKNHWQLIV